MRGQGHRAAAEEGRRARTRGLRETHEALVPREQQHSKLRNDAVRPAFLKDFLLTYS